MQCTHAAKRWSMTRAESILGGYEHQFLFFPKMGCQKKMLRTRYHAERYHRGVRSGLVYRMEARGGSLCEMNNVQNDVN